ncbi:hypothetical protein HDV63DRAFT_350744 [Trichoderma sp. SZMC 28014]
MFPGPLPVFSYSPLFSPKLSNYQAEKPHWRTIQSFANMSTFARLSLEIQTYKRNQGRFWGSDCHLLWTGCHLLWTDCHLLWTGCHLLWTDCHLLWTDCHLLWTGCHLLWTGCHLLRTGCHLLRVDCQCRLLYLFCSTSPSQPPSPGTTRSTVYSMQSTYLGVDFRVTSQSVIVTKSACSLQGSESFTDACLGDIGAHVCIRDVSFSIGAFIWNCRQDIAFSIGGFICDCSQDIAFSIGGFI